ncbi:MAG: hypothetical protein WC538_17790 [Thermoanaerobaculia bacterium]|jgi:hypothetical protein
MLRYFTSLLIVGAALVSTSGCCSTSESQLATCAAHYSELQRQREQLEASTTHARAESERLTLELVQSRREAQELQARLNSSESRRLQLESSEIGIVSDQLVACRIERESAVRDARYMGSLEGANSVLSSIQVVGSAEKVEGVIFDDYYYTFQVRLGSRSFVGFRVQTKKEESGFGSALGSITGLAPAVLALLPK